VNFESVFSCLKFVMFFIIFGNIFCVLIKWETTHLSSKKNKSCIYIAVELTELRERITEGDDFIRSRAEALFVYCK
jgi:hypothetical protein